ncbi:MAG: ATPase [Chloroflexi bacterium]|nr:ATPase [Chloroflexota bacterium]
MNRVKTGVRGLDEMLNGGFLPQTANLFEGAPGTGKSTLGMQFIYNGVAQWNEPGLILTFEEFPQQYYRDAESFGWDLHALERANKLRVIMSSPQVTRRDLETVGGNIETIVREMGARRILIDSLSHLSRLEKDPVERRALEFAFVNALKREGLTTFLTRESFTFPNPQIDPEPGVGFLVDSYSLLRYVEIDSEMRRALLILKMRGSDHARDIREFQITGEGIEVQSKFKGREGIMSGSPRQMADSFIEAFVKR